VHSVETSHVRVIHRFYPGLGEGEKEALAEALEDDLHGLIMVPGDPLTVAPLLKKAAERGLPVVCVNTDAPEVEHLVTVCVDSLTTGSLVGELMGRFLAGKGRVMVVTGQLSTIDHAQKVTGFRRTLSEMWPDLRVDAVVEAHDHEREAYEKSRQVLTSTPDIGGVYVSTVNSIPVLRAIEDVGLAGRATVITSDLFPALGPFIGTGRRHHVPAPFHAGPARIPGALQVPRRWRPAPPGDPAGSPHRDEGQPEALHGPPALAHGQGPARPWRARRRRAPRSRGARSPSMLAPPDCQSRVE
jgi:hypothetical protein